MRKVDVIALVVMIPTEKKISSKKITYVYRVPDKDLMVIAGYFE